MYCLIRIGHTAGSVSPSMQPAEALAIDQVSPISSFLWEVRDHTKV
jgi:hypothetical protein